MLGVGLAVLLLAMVSLAGAVAAHGSQARDPGLGEPADSLPQRLGLELCDGLVLDVELDGPDGGEHLGGAAPATWTSTGSVLDAEVGLWYHDGSSWHEIVERIDDDGSETWDTTAVPDSLDGIVYIWARPLSGVVDDCYTRDWSDATFAVDNTPPATSVSAPAAGDLVAGDVDLLWSTSDANPDEVGVQVSTDGGATWSQVVGATPDDGAYTWDSTTVPDGDEVRLRVVAVDEIGNVGAPAATDSFTVDNTPPDVTVTQPAAGDVLAGTTTVEWTSVEAHKDVVSIEVSDDGGSTWTLLNGSTPDDGSDTWDTTGVPDGTYVLRVTATDLLGHVGQATTDAFDVDNTPPAVTILDPFEGDTVAGTVTIGWDTVDAHRDSVAIEVSDDGGSTWTEVVASTPDDGAYDWDTTQVPNGTYTLRLTATDQVGHTGDATVPDIHVANAASDTSGGTSDDDGSDGDGGDGTGTSGDDGGGDGSGTDDDGGDGGDGSDGSGTSDDTTDNGASTGDQTVVEEPLSGNGSLMLETGDDRVVALHLHYDPNASGGAPDRATVNVSRTGDAATCTAPLPEGYVWVDAFGLDVLFDGLPAAERGLLNATVFVRVEADRAERDGLATGEAYLFHCTEDAWTAIPAARVASDPGYLYRAEVTSFSPFAFGFVPGDGAETDATDEGSRLVLGPVVVGPADLWWLLLLALAVTTGAVAHRSLRDEGGLPGAVAGRVGPRLDRLAEREGWAGRAARIVRRAGRSVGRAGETAGRALRRTGTALRRVVEALVAALRRTGAGLAAGAARLRDGLLSALGRR